jgi:hypothetical protein
VARDSEQHSPAVCDAASSREMGPDVPSKRDTGRSEGKASRSNPLTERDRMMVPDGSA